jgi:catechol 2,3-dioxygenase-like lactoylglutathione lyase family enzyme
MDHVSIPVTDVARTKAFYEAILMPLGWTCSGWRADVYVGFKKKGSPALYFGAAVRTAQVHLAFKADSEEQVKEFHRAESADFRQQVLLAADDQVHVLVKTDSYARSGGRPCSLIVSPACLTSSSPPLPAAWVEHLASDAEVDSEEADACATLPILT